MCRATPKGNEAKLEMKQPSAIDRAGFEPRLYRFVANHATIKATEAPPSSIMAQIPKRIIIP